MLGLLGVILLIACTNPDFHPEREVKVSWELISNQVDTTPAALAVFTFKNTSRHDWKDTSWAFYFSQAPRNIIKFSGDLPLLIERLSGDWYRIKPGNGFSLKAGQSVRLEYEMEAWLIKESDAPAGAYWQLKAGRIEKTEIAAIELMPFTRPEQLSRFLDDHEPIPHPTYDFEKYQNLKELPEHKLPPVVPFPASYKPNAGSAFLCEVIIQAPDVLQNEKELLVQWLKKHTSLKIQKDKKPLSDPAYVIVLKLNTSLQNEGNEFYRMHVDSSHAMIEAPSSAGIFYGCQTFQALLPVDSLLKKSSSLVIPCIEIKDRPRFAYRGMHLDVARNFIPLENLLKIIDLLSFYKINTLHLHLTDDEGWRIEIPALPELTQIGAYRKHTYKNSAALHPSYGSGPQAIGGYYSRKDFIKLLKYCAQRHITVVPEINLPGHARAAIRAMEARYSRLIAMGDSAAAEAFRLIDPADTSSYLSAQFYDDNVVSVVKEQVYVFMDTVIKALVEQYAEAGLKLNVLHTGGDEVPRGAWEGSPLVHQWLINNPDKKLDDLHGYYLTRLIDILSKYGIRAAGWEEIALKQEKGQRVINPAFAATGAIAYVWNNLWGAQDLGYRLANRNYSVVLCHVTALYFDLAYSKDPREPGLYWGGFVDEYKTWFYNPLNVFQTTRNDELGRKIEPAIAYRNMERLAPQAVKNILGLQAQLWSETLKSPAMAEYYMLPKLISFAQVSWSPARKWESTHSTNMDEKVLHEEWNVFANVLGKKEVPRLSILFGGFQYRIPPPGVKIIGKTVCVAAPWPGIRVRYASGGTKLSNSSPSVPSGSCIPWEKGLRLATFDKAGKSSPIVVIDSLLPKR